MAGVTVFHPGIPPHIEKKLRERPRMTPVEVRAAIDAIPEQVRREIERETFEVLFLMLYDKGMSEAAMWLEKVTSVKHPGDGR